MFKKYKYGEVSSTNDVAKKLLEKENAVFVTADFQKNGKGRNGRKWFGDKQKNIYASFGFKTEQGESGDEISRYQMLGCLAVLKTLKEIAPNITFALKYPNDVIASGGALKGKISGVLCEHEFMGMLCFKTIIGIGINVSQEEFDEVENNTPVSLKLLKIETEKEILLEKLLKNIKILLKENRENIMELWKTELNILDKSFKISGLDGNWEVREIMNDGRLKAFKNGEMKIIDNGDSIRYV